MPHIGPILAARLDEKGIHSYEKLEEVWNERGRDRRKMLGWLLKSMPGSNKMVLAKAVQGMVSEFGA